MAIRFRKSIKIAPGVRLNVSKSGISTSVGGKGATANFSKRGTRVTVGIPGSGLSASKLYSSRGPASADASGGLSGKAVMIVVAVVVFVIWLIVG
ncbi:DUF4236 domain-containing protein [Stutzerimonas degradans]|uniref:DUF4236 domain-containing protein n=1 Tax=Stutzerimonas degradans TaxID=2968968 RepID=UPI001424888A|nr:DUF4236 domain-containing protein [Stutzerimonas degradans]MCQ4267391.1 DUF4236 domain-containing protein [Stutzerimonas degradans]NHW01929.1 DUF4236 domain-containing protein [Stutzerimonas degradans]